MEDELLPPPPKKVSNKVEEDFLLPPPPKKKLTDTPTLSDIGQPFTSGVQTPLVKPSPLVSNLKSTSETKPKQVNPFTAPIEEVRSQYKEDYSKEKQLNRQKNYTQGLEKLSKRVETLIPQYETQVSELGQLDAELEGLKQDPNAYNQAIQIRNQKVGEITKLADSLRTEKEKADIYEKGLGAVDILRRSNEDTFGNRTQSALNTLGIMGITMLPTMARGAKVIDSYLQSKAMGLNEQEAELYQKAQTEITKKNWKGLTDVAREFYDKNQILEGGFSKESGFDKIKEGDYKAAGNLLAKELVQNLPVALGIGASFVNPLAGAAFTIGGTAGAELQDMDINNPQMSEQAKIANAFVKGGSEYVTEKIFGTFNYLGRIAGGSIKSQAGKKMLMGSIKEAYEQVAKRFGLGADVIEEVSTEMLNKIVGDYADYTSGKTSELDFKKGLGETITTALSTSLLLGGAGRAVKYGNKKIDDLRAKARQLEVTLQDPSVKPEIANAVREEVLNVNQQIGDEAAKAKATYDALPEEQQNRVDALVEEKNATEQLLQDPQLPQEIKPSVEEKLNTIQSEIDNEYKSVDKKLIPTEESKLEEIINEPIKETETPITPSSSPSSEVSAPNNVEVNEPRTIKSNIPSSDKGTQTTEPTKQEGETKVDQEEKTPIGETAETPQSGIKSTETNQIIPDRVSELRAAEQAEYDDMSNPKNKAESVVVGGEVKTMDDFNTFKDAVAYNVKRTADIGIDESEANYGNYKNINEIKSDLKKAGIQVEKVSQSSMLDGNYASFDGDKIKVTDENIPIQVLLHEIGEKVILDLDKAKQKIEHANNIFEAVTTYGASRGNDAFSDNFYLYFLSPQTLKDLSPNVYTELDKLIPQNIKDLGKSIMSKYGVTEQTLKYNKPKVEELTRPKTNEIEKTEISKTEPSSETKSSEGSEEKSKEVIQKDNLVQSIASFNKSISSKKGVTNKGRTNAQKNEYSRIKNVAEKLGLKFNETSDGKIEVLNEKGKKITKTRSVEVVEEPTQEALDNFKKLFKNGVITPQIESSILEPTQIKDLINAYRNGKITKDAKRLINELADVNEESVIRYKEYTGTNWVYFEVPLSEMINEEVSIENLSKEEINQLSDMFDETFGNIDEETHNKLNDIFNENENEQGNEGKNNVSTSSSKEKGTNKEVNPKVVKTIEQVLAKEVSESGELSKSATTRKNKRETALKEVTENLDAKDKVAVEHIVKNLDLIRQKLLDARLIESIDCKWAKK